MVVTKRKGRGRKLNVAFQISDIKCWPITSKTGEFPSRPECPPAGGESDGEPHPCTKNRLG